MSDELVVWSLICAISQILPRNNIKFSILCTQQKAVDSYGFLKRVLFDVYLKLHVEFKYYTWSMHLYYKKVWCEGCLITFLMSVPGFFCTGTFTSNFLVSSIVIFILSHRMLFLPLKSYISGCCWRGKVLSTDRNPLNHWWSSVGLNSLAINQQLVVVSHSAWCTLK